MPAKRRNTTVLKDASAEVVKTYFVHHDVMEMSW